MVRFKVARACSVGWVISAVALVASSRAAAPESTPAKVEPVERTDPNSRAAHEQLLRKAKAGRIDVYFAGDSIVRRWGATDYPHLLQNWRKNFFGWNAADFGWGGDTTRNVLWRLCHGEMDDVHPKVIVLLVGTNDVAARARPGETDDERAAQVATGVQAIVETMRAKAPDATIVITALFPRNDDMTLMPVIAKVNRIVAGLTDGKRVRFLDVNDNLADGSGKLLDGMMNADKLHPAPAGYQVWADALKPLLTELLGQPAKEDHAPSPTGDPSAVNRNPRGS